MFISLFSSKYNFLGCGRARATICRSRASDPALNMNIGTTVVKTDIQTARSWHLVLEASSKSWQYVQSMQTCTHVATSPTDGKRYKKFNNATFSPQNTQVRTLPEHTFHPYHQHRRQRQRICLPICHSPWNPIDLTAAPRRCMPTNSPATLRIINECPPPKTPCPCYRDAATTRVVWPELQMCGQVPPVNMLPHFCSQDISTAPVPLPHWTL